MPARPSARASSAMTPGRLGTDTRSSRDRAAVRGGLQQRAAALRRLGLPALERVAVAARSAARTSSRRSTASSTALDERVAVGQRRCRSRARGLAPATRVASRKLGPIAGSAERARPARRARWPARAAGGRRRPSAGRAPRRRRPRGARRAPATKRCRRSSSSPSVRAAGVRYQVAPSKRSSRACSTPPVSAPASGCPPTKRRSLAHDHALRRADVGDDAVGRRGGEHRVDGLGQDADRGRDDGELGVLERPGQVARAVAPRAPPRAAGRRRGRWPRRGGGRPARPTRR